MSSRSILRPIAPGVSVAEQPQRFFGLEIGSRMTVLETDAGVLVHSPLGTPADLGDKTPRWALAPNLFHHLSAGNWSSSGVETWAAKGLAAKRADLSFAGEVEPGDQPFGPDIQLFPLQSLPITNEVVV